VQLYTEKKWGEAEAAFRSAWALNPTFDVAYNLGNTEYRLGKYRDAAEYLSFALRVWPLLESTAGLRPIAEKRLAESRAFIGALTVKVNVEHAEVLVDGQVVGKAPLPGEVFVTPGAHVLEAKLKGYVGAKEAVQIDKGAAKTIELKLSAIVPMDAAGGEAVATAKPQEGLARGTESAVSDGGLRKKLIIAGIASSAVAITGGVVLAIVSNGHGTDADSQQAALLQEAGGRACEMPTTLAQRCEQQRSSLATRDTFRDLSIWSFVAGGAVGIGTAVYGLATTRAKPTSAVRVVPVATAHAGGLVIVGEW
jgi:hypothetical protein